MKIIFLIILWLGSLTAYAQEELHLHLVQSSPEAAGMSSSRLDKLDNRLETYVQKGILPGIVALVVREGKVVFHKAYGQADMSDGEQMKKDHIFRIASQTKAITATAVMMLWEEGHFRLDDPISKYIPEFAKMTVLDSVKADGSYATSPAKGPITIRQLLTHTSGLGYGMIDPDPRFKKMYQDAGIIDAWTTQPVTIKENTVKLAKLPLHFNPGERYLYGEGLDVLGYFVEIISEKSFSQFLRERIFEPLGMVDTYFYLPEDRADRLVAIHTKQSGKWEKYPNTLYDQDFPIKGARQFFSGGAGLSSTVMDYAKFLQMYLNGGLFNSHQILSKTTIESMMRNQIGDFWGKGGKTYGLAFGLVNNRGVAEGGIGSKGTFDWGGYFNTQYFADPQENIIGLIFKQIEGGGYEDPTGWQFRQMVMASVVR